MQNDCVEVKKVLKIFNVVHLAVQCSASSQGNRMPIEYNAAFYSETDCPGYSCVRTLCEHAIKIGLPRLVLKHGTPERRNAGILKPGTQNY